MTSKERKSAKEARKTERQKVEERREEVLAQGRKFKYPMQFAKYKLVIYTVVIAVLAVVLLVVAGWFSLYKAQSNSDMMYRVAQALSLPVAEIDGEKVKYGDYLMIYRSSLTTVEQQSGKLGDSEDDQETRRSYKRAAMDSAEEYTYALKLGREQGIEVTDEEVAESFAEHRKVGGTERSEESFLKVIQDNFGMNKGEYERMLYLTLMKSKVMAAIDAEAQRMAERVEQLIGEKEGELAAVAEELGDAVEYEETGGLVGNTNIDGGRAAMAATLSDGEISERFLSSNGDGYYYVKLISKTDTQVNYTSIKVSFGEFASRVQELRDEGAVAEYVEI